MKYLVCELLITVIHPMPWFWNIRIYFDNFMKYDTELKAFSIVYYHVNEILTLIMLLRIILIIRTLLMMSNWYCNRTSRVCNMYACEADYLFVIKCSMKERPYTIITIAMLVSIFSFGYAVRICEAPL